MKGSRQTDCTNDNKEQGSRTGSQGELAENERRRNDYEREIFVLQQDMETANERIKRQEKQKILQRIES